MAMTRLRSSQRALSALVALALAGCPSTPPVQQCRFNDDCDAPLVCSAGYCRPQCAQDRDCPSGALCVSWRTEAVRLCLRNGSAPVCSTNECSAGLACVGGLCARSCATDPDCLSMHSSARCGVGGRCVISGLILGPTCDGGTACGARCVDTTSDDSNCGACGNVCGVDQRCAGGRCSSASDAGGQ